MSLTYFSGTLYNKQRYHLYRVQNLQFMAACVPPGAGTSCGGVASFAISHRLSRLMTVLSFFPLSCDSLETVYSSVFLSWLEEFPAYSLTHHEHLAKVGTRDVHLVKAQGWIMPSTGQVIVRWISANKTI